MPRHGTGPQRMDPKKRDPMVNSTTGKPLSETPKQVRARLRRRAERYGGADPKGIVTTREVELLYKKPIEQWDNEELARGRTRDKNGGFMGSAPGFITREMQEKAFQLLTKKLRQENSVLSLTAQKIIAELLEDDERDENGRPITPAAVKAKLADSVLDRVLGKATTPIVAEVSVKLESVLADVMVDGPGQLSSSHAPIMDAEFTEDDDDEEDEDDEDG